MIKKSSRALILMLASTMLLRSACGETSNKKESELDQSVGNSEQIESSETESVGSEYPEYLNLDSEYPIIKDEYAGTVKPKLMVCFRDTAGDWAELWLPKYLKEKYNVEFDVEVVYTSALSERKSLMLNSGELPDIIMNCSVNVAEIVEYGVEQGMLLKCDEYINETLTPNLAKWLEKENVVDASTSIDGHIYGLPNIGAEKDPGSYDAKNFINTTWLKELNIEMPRTLDDFTAAMYAIKEADLA